MTTTIRCWPRCTRSPCLPILDRGRERCWAGCSISTRAKDATHPVPGGAGSVSQVFLLPLPGAANRPAPHKSSKVVITDDGAALSGDIPSSPEIAVVNLTSNFVASHPSGLETETLTVLSICGTIHANLPRVTEVRFLVDGQQRPTLAGHADLTRTYLVSDAVAAANASGGGLAP